VERRVGDALDRVRPYLGSHGGDVQLLEVAGEVVRLRFTGSCKSCPSSAVTLELAVEDAVLAAAPEVGSIEVVAAEDSSSAGVIPVESLMNRLHRTTWQPVPELANLAAGEVGGFLVAGNVMLACRVGESYFAYRDRCPNCTGSLAGAPLSGAELRCPGCDSAFDAMHAGAAIDGDGHLEPVPLLVRDGVLSMAVAVEEVAS
jgi:Fe-S cluster biogenesis protein NfuA/nitrite reductase/ring-hydroxylating ferredoxin subunit